MNKILLSLFLTIFFAGIAYAQPSGAKFEIAGKLSGYADSSLFYLDDATTYLAIRIDSAFLINGQFHFSGSLNEAVKRVMLSTKGNSDYKFFWLENAHLTFKAEKGKFRDAIITGSQSQHEQDQLDADIKSSGKKMEQNLLFIQGHPNSIVSAHLLSTYSFDWGKDTTIMLYNKLAEKIKKTFYSKDILEFITLNGNLKLGDKYIDFEETNIEGKKVSLSDFEGKIVLLEFWGSWCGPCRADNPELVKIYNEFNHLGFDILGVASDDKKENWLNAVKKDSLPWQNVSDLKGDRNIAALIYGVSSYPANFLIDRNGIIIARDLRGNALRTKLQELLR